MSEGLPIDDITKCRVALIMRLSRDVEKRTKSVSPPSALLTPEQVEAHKNLLNKLWLMRELIEKGKHTMSSINVFQRIAWDWCLRTFGEGIACSHSERAIRIVEETVELCQSVGVDKDILHRLIDVVYSRKSGDKWQEVGGIMVTLMVFCEQQGFVLQDAAEAEIIRILNKPKEEMRARMEEKIREGVTDGKL